MPARPASPVIPAAQRRLSSRETLLRPRKKPVQGRSRVTVDAILEAAARLFAYLRAADRLKPRGIAVAPIPEHGLGEAINDRLRRAAGFIG